MSEVYCFFFTQRYFVLPKLQIIFMDTMCEVLLQSWKEIFYFVFRILIQNYKNLFFVDHK